MGEEEWEESGVVGFLVSSCLFGKSLTYARMETPPSDGIFG